MSPASNVRPGTRRTRTPTALKRFMEEGLAAPSPQEMAQTEAPAPAVSPLPEPVKPPVYEGPAVDPWDVLRRELSPMALRALEEVTGKPQTVGLGNAPWYECWNVDEGRPSGHPPFQGFVKPGQHVYCPYVDPDRGTCGRKTVKPLENYVPA